VEAWIDKKNIPGLTKKVITAKDRTPLLLLDLPGDHDYQVLMYGHLDKQPEMTGWAEDLGPWKAVRKGDKLYGRGGADDGYAVFASVCAMEHLIKTKAKRPHIKVAIEFSEESGSNDLPFYFENHLKEFGSPNLIVCLDSGAGNYEQFWSTTSLRGLVNGTLRVDILNEGVHSGDASGVVPSSFRIARTILDRLENVSTGEILPDAFKVSIPEQRLDQADRSAKALGDKIYTKFPFTGKAGPNAGSPKELLLNKTWRAALSVTGADGLPEPVKAGNVLRPYTTLKLSLRLPPTVDAKQAAPKLKKLLEETPPYGAKVEFHVEDAATGWNAPETKPELETLIQEASQAFYGKEALTIGEGGSIPFMGMLGETFPKAQFIITGVLGPNSNAHGPNEFIHIEYAKKLTAAITHILAKVK
ncbi:MAG: M20/M25/M40 family metallo-hydrolase, partial [Bdellovibrionales bacterium]|nr:M20/M25/M40 family metallo-hydrolase [Bdellovibrionales bacterium]